MSLVTYFDFTTGGTFVFDNPETGLIRITVAGDWTNNMDLFAIAPNGLTNLLGATSNNPEVVVVNNQRPARGE